MEQDNNAEKQIMEGDDLFSKMEELNPLRDDEIEDDDLEDDDGEPITLSESIDRNRKLTDLQIADKRLNPDLGYRFLNVTQMSRTFPDSYNPLFIIYVKDLIKKSLAKGVPISVAEAIAYVNTALSISIDGEGRIDEIVVTKGRGQVEDQNKGVSIS